MELESPAARFSPALAVASAPARPRRSVPRILSGSIEEVPVPSVLQVVGVLGIRELCVRVQAGASPVGRIWVDGESVLHARLGTGQGKPALRRLFEWSKGTFRVFHEACPCKPTIAEPISKCLLDGCLYQDLYRELREAGSSFAIDYKRLEEVTADDGGWRLLTIVESEKRLDAILASSPFDELETLDFLSQLHHGGLISGH